MLFHWEYNSFIYLKTKPIIFFSEELSNKELNFREIGIELLDYFDYFDDFEEIILKH